MAYCGQKLTDSWRMAVLALVFAAGLAVGWGGARLMFSRPPPVRHTARLESKLPIAPVPVATQIGRAHV